MSTTPDLISPADGATARLLTLVFRWQPVTGGGNYILEIATDSGFANIISQLQTTGTKIEASFPLGNLYYWRVRIGSAFSATTRVFSAPPFSPAAVTSHQADGKARVLTQFLEVA